MENNSKEEEKKDRFKEVREFVFKHMVWLLLLLSTIFILLSKLDFFIPQVNDFLEKLGFTVASSGVFAAVLKSIQFTGIFKAELEDVIYGDKFIEQRAKKENLWIRVSKAIYKKRFPGISKRLNKIILEEYFPKKKNYYYDNYVVSLKITELQKNGLIKFIQNISYDVIMETGETKAVLEGGYILDKPDSGSDIKHTNKRECFKIIKKDKKGNEIVEDILENFGKYKKNGSTDFKSIYFYEIPVENNGNFSVQVKDAREYNIFEDNNKLFRTSAITKSMKFHVSFPDNMHVQFFNLGIVGEFKQLYVENQNSITREYTEELILPNQGFGISFGFKSVEFIK